MTRRCGKHSFPVLEGLRSPARPRAGRSQPGGLGLQSAARTSRVLGFRFAEHVAELEGPGAGLIRTLQPGRSFSKTTKPAPYRTGSGVWPHGWHRATRTRNSVLRMKMGPLLTWPSAASRPPFASCCGAVRGPAPSPSGLECAGRALAGDLDCCRRTPKNRACKTIFAFDTRRIAKRPSIVAISPTQHSQLVQLRQLAE